MTVSAHSWQNFRFHRTALGVCAAFSLVGALVPFAKSRITSPPVARTIVEPVLMPPMALTNLRGRARTPAISPDGTRVAFSWNGEGERPGIYIKQVGSDQLPRQLPGTGEGDLYPVWSPDGRSIAFLRNPGGSASVIIKPIEQGPERELLEVSGRSLAWSRAANLLAVEHRSSADQPYSLFLVSPLTGEKRRIVIPDPGPMGDPTVAFSNDGRWMAFVRWTTASASDLYVLALFNGGIRRITWDGRPIHGATWTPDSKRIIFSSDRSGKRRLWSMDPLCGEGCSPHPLLSGEGQPAFPAVLNSKAGEPVRLVYERDVAAKTMAQVGVPEKTANDYVDSDRILELASVTSDISRDWRMAQLAKAFWSRYGRD